jgi:hypothetical protein
MISQKIVVTDGMLIQMSEFQISKLNTIKELLIREDLY